MKKHVFAVPFTLVVAALAWSAPRLALAQDATPAPAVSPIPSYPEKSSSGAPAPSVASAGAKDGAIRVDRAGMFGAGFAIGNTSTGGTAKLWFSPDVAMQFGAGAGPLGNNVRFQLDLLYSYYRWDAEDGQYSLPFYFGIGGQAGIFFKYPYPADRTDVGVRVPVGMSIVVPNNPVEIFFEIAPDGAVYDDKISKKTRGVFYVDGQIGMRYYF